MDIGCGNALWLTWCWKVSAGSRKRLHAYETRHGRKLPNKNLHIIGVDPVEGFDIRNHDHCTELAASLPQDCIIVVDTLSQAALGRNENTSEDGGKVLAGAVSWQVRAVSSCSWPIARTRHAAFPAGMAFLLRWT